MAAEAKAEVEAEEKKEEVKKKGDQMGSPETKQRKEAPAEDVVAAVDEVQTEPGAPRRSALCHSTLKQLLCVCM